MAKMKDCNGVLTGLTRTAFVLGVPRLETIIEREAAPSLTLITRAPRSRNLEVSQVSQKTKQKDRNLKKISFFRKLTNCAGSA